MESIYDRPRLVLYKKRAQAARKLSYQAQQADDEHRKAGKTLRVVPYPQGGEHVPSVRVAGKWLLRHAGWKGSSHKSAGSFSLGTKRAAKGHATIP